MKRNICLAGLALVLGVFLLLVPRVSSAQQWSLRGPAPRVRHSAVLATAQDKMIVFGGITESLDAPPNTYFNDVWYLTSAFSTSPNLTWQQAITTGTPPNPRGGHSAVLDSVNNRMIVFGGAQGPAGTASNDVWVLENADGIGGTPKWVQLSPVGPLPPARFNHVAVYNSTSNRMIIFGGYSGSNTEFNDVWVLQNANGLGGTPTWINSIAQGASIIAVRDSCSAVYDVTNNIMIVFGGDNAITGTFYSDTWILSDADDTQSQLCSGAGCWSGPLNTNGFPPPSARYGHTAFFDSKTDTMHIFGGYDGTNLLNDYWVLTGANALSGNWSQLSPSGTTPLPRAGHTAVYDSSNHRMVIFGGEITTPGIMTDTVAVLNNATTQQ